MSSGASPERIQAFITKWELSGANELGNAQSFINELCGILEVEPPHAGTGDEARNAYVYNKTIPGPEGSKNFIDCYKRGCFILETKQGADRDTSTPLSEEGEQRKRKLKTGHGVRGTMGYATAMEKARAQAERYVRSLPKEELSDGLRPPLLLVADVGHSIALYAEWSRTGGHYAPFPDPASYRILLKDLLRSEVRERLRAVWTDPLSLDPNRRSAKVTREIAQRLGQLALSLEGKYEPERVANFLMRCLFTMFSEDVDLLPVGSYTALLGNLKKDPATFVPAMKSLWESMNTGGYAAILQKVVPRFNGGLFKSADALPLDADQIQLLIEASTRNWRDVEPAIFGTLLERALDPRERHKLGAHYTPRSYVERLVVPTVIEPLRAEWASVQVAAAQLDADGRTDKAVAEVKGYLDRLAHVRVLDPACGSGNFLYVTLELLKRLEGEVLNTLRDLGYVQNKLELENVMVTPANLLGIEVNPRATAIAELVLWIGFLQWHLRTHGNLSTVPEPILRNHHNIVCRDAVLEWDSEEPLLDDAGQPVTRWDGRTTKPHPVTGEEVPDPAARVQAMKYHNARATSWPKTDYIVGNPPFIGNKRMRVALGDDYVEALRGTYSKLSASIDFVMYWWDHAAQLLAQNKIKRFGFITTNSITQTFNRSVIEGYLDGKKPISVVYATPDHPWVDSADGAAVRIAMSVAQGGRHEGMLAQVIGEIEGEGGEIQVTLKATWDIIHSTLEVGADVASAAELEANEGLASQGANPLGVGFRLRREDVEKYGYSVSRLPAVVRPYSIGRDIVQRPEEKYVIDFIGMTEDEARVGHPALYQHLLLYVKPERDQNRRETRRVNWWLFGESAPMFRKASMGLTRYIATCRTAKHRLFTMLPVATIPDAKIVAVAIEDYYVLGVLSSTTHATWAIHSGAWLGVGNDSNYNHSECFGKFPFPAATLAQQQKIRELGEKLDAHRKRQQAAHQSLTMTDMYNVLEKERANEPLTAKERKTHEEGLVGILRQLHDELDAAVAEAYGWADLSPTNVTPGEALRDPESHKDVILTRLVALNAERSAEEAKGQVRWLRPEYQQKSLTKGRQAVLDVDGESATPAAAATSLRAWPAELPAQAAALSAVLGGLQAPTDVATIAGYFEGKKTKKKLEEITRLLETLGALGRARPAEDGWHSI